MSRYNRFPPYIPVAKRREKALKQMAKLTKKGVDIDPVKKEIHWRLPDIKLDWVSAKIPVSNEWVEASWERKAGKVIKKISLPAHFSLKE